MKTYNNLFEKIVDPKNVHAAIFEAAKHKRHKRSVQKALENAPDLALQISNWLKEGTWRPVGIHNCTLINDGINLKKRLIVCPSFVKDQIVHHAIMRVVYPLFAKKFYRYSCGSVKGKGSEFAKKYIEKKIRASSGQTKYATQLDIKKFFNTVKPSFVFKTLRKTIRDRKTLGLIALILRNNKMRIKEKYLNLTEGLKVLRKGKKDNLIVKGGLPIGFYTSPIFANILLSSLDHQIKEDMQTPVYVRYMDDILIMGSNKRKLTVICSQIEQKLEKIGLSLKRKPAIHRFGKQSRCVDFMGFVFSRTKTILRDKVFLRTRRILKKISKKLRLTKFDANRIISMAGRFKNADMRSAFQRLFKAIVSIKACRRIISQAAKRGVKWNTENQKAILDPKKLKQYQTAVTL